VGGEVPRGVRRWQVLKFGSLLQQY